MTKLKTIKKMSMVLDLFTFKKSEWSISEIASRTGLYKSVVHRLVNSLVAEGFMNKDPETKKYKLGIKFFELGKIVEKQMELKKIARPIMEKLTSKCNQGTILCVLSDLQQVCISKTDTSKIIQIASQIGVRIKLHAGASAKLLLAYLPRKKREEYYEKYELKSFTDKTITDREDLEDNLVEIREKGYAFTVEERDEGVAGIAVPIFNYRKEVVASLTMLGPKWNYKDEAVIKEYIKSLREAAAEISRKLGYKYNDYIKEGNHE
ncbi:MAG: IclR family transcriptional regulator [Halanaerobiaceae bacterium]